MKQSGLVPCCIAVVFVVFFWAYAEAQEPAAEKDQGQSAELVQIEEIASVDGPAMVLGKRSLDSEALAILITPYTEPGTRPDDPSGERLIIIDPRRGHAVTVLSRTDAAETGEWSSMSVEWSPGGEYLLVEAQQRDYTQAWFEVRWSEDKPGFALDTMVIPPVGGDARKDWHMVPLFNNKGEMRAVPYNYWVRPSGTVRTSENTHHDWAGTRGIRVSSSDAPVVHSIIVEGGSGVLIVATGNNVHRALYMDASIIGDILLFDWDGRSWAASWDSGETANIKIPGIPGGFRGIDLGPETCTVRPLAQLTSRKAVLWVENEDGGKLIRVSPYQVFP